MNRIAILAAFVFIIGMSGAALACEEDIYASNEPTVLACNGNNCATDEQQATTPPQATGCSSGACATALKELSDATVHAVDSARVSAKACSSSNCGKTPEPTESTPPQRTCGTGQC